MKGADARLAGKVASTSISSFVGLVALLVSAPAALASSILPEGSQQFVDANGQPLVGGSVCLYVVGTTTPKLSWQDRSQSTPNATPCLTLDSAGRAVIWGYGQYREQVFDQFGNLIWDKPISEYVSDVQNDSFNWGGVATSVANTYSISVVPAPPAYVAGQQFSFVVNTANSGAATLNVASLGPKALDKVSFGGPVPLSGSELDSGNILFVEYDGSEFQIVGQIPVAAGGASCGSSFTQWRVLVATTTTTCGNSTIWDNTQTISATLTPAGSGNGQVWLLDPSNENVFMGDSAGTTNSSTDTIALGDFAGIGLTGSDIVAIGDGAGQTSVGNNQVMMGSSAGSGADVGQLVALGFGAAANMNRMGGSTDVVAIGDDAAASSKLTDAVVIGQIAGESATDGDDIVYIGDHAGGSASISTLAVCIGSSNCAGASGSQIVSLGFSAGSSLSGAPTDIVAIGDEADAGGSTGSNVIAIGNTAANLSTGSEMIAIGNRAGVNNSGANTVLAGWGAGYINQGSNVIIISNATGISGCIPSGCVANTNSNFIDVGEVWKAQGINTPTTATSTLSGQVLLPNLSTTPGGKQPLCVDTGTGKLYFGSGSAC